MLKCNVLPLLRPCVTELWLASIPRPVFSSPGIRLIKTKPELCDRLSSDSKSERDETVVVIVNALDIRTDFLCNYLLSLRRNGVTQRARGGAAVAPTQGLWELSIRHIKAGGGREQHHNLTAAVGYSSSHFLRQIHHSYKMAARFSVSCLFTSIYTLYIPQSIQPQATTSSNNISVFILCRSICVCATVLKLNGVEITWFTYIFARFCS